MEKTYKREVAGAMLVAVAGLAVASFFAPNPEPVVEIFKTVIYPVMGYVGFAFGMDSYAKQVKG